MGQKEWPSEQRLEPLVLTLFHNRGATVALVTFITRFWSVPRRVVASFPSNAALSPITRA
jgi:hypothetical protein